MPHSKLLQKAFEVVRREPALWILGFIVALFGGGSGGSGSGNWSGGGEELGMPNQGPPDMPAWFTPENLIIMAACFVGFLILLAIVGLVIQSVAMAGLIDGTARAAEGEDVHWRELLGVGWSQLGRRILGMKILLALPMLLMGALFFACIAVPAISFVSALENSALSEEALMEQVIQNFALLIPMLCLGVPVLLLLQWGLELTGNYAARAIVLEGQPVRAAIGRGWQLLRHNMADTLVFSIILGVVGMLVGFLFAFAFLLLGAMLFIPFYLFLSAGEPSLMMIALIGVPLVLLLILLGAMLQGPLVAYFETAWTLAWQHLRGDATEPVEQPMPLVPDPLY